MPRPPERLQTARLLLRRPRAEDAPVIFKEYAQDPAVTRYLSWSPHRDPAQTAAFVASCGERWADGCAFPFCIALRDGTDAPVGMVELRLDAHKAQFGYVLTRRLWGQGLMPEALAGLLDWTLAQPSLFRAEAFCDAENSASARVMAKAGMAFEGILHRWCVHPNLDAEPRDCRMYARVRS